MQKAVVAFAESLPIGLEARRRNGRIAVTRVMIEDRWLTNLNVVARGLEAVLVTLLMYCLEVDDGRRRGVDGLRVGTSCQQSGGECCRDAESFLNGGLLRDLVSVRPPRDI